MSILGVKLDVKSFEATADIHGTKRDVAFCPENKDEESGRVYEPSVLVIKGLSLDDAIHVLKSLEGGLLKGKDAEHNAMVTPDTPAPAAKEQKAQAKKEKAEKPKVIEAKAEEKKPEPKPEPKVEVVDESDDVADDLGDDLDEGGDTSLDVAAMAKMEKLRPVVEHMISRGLKTAKEIVEASKPLIEQVPALKEVNAKGNFEKRMERAFLVISGADQAS